MAKKDSASETSGKDQALDLAIAQITKQFGDGSIMKLGEATAYRLFEFGFSPWWRLSKGSYY